MLQTKLPLPWTVVYYGTQIAEMFSMGYCFYRLAGPFMEKKKRTFGVGISYSLTMLLLYVIPLLLDSFLAYGIGVLAAFFTMCRMDRRNYRQKVFLAVTFFLLHWFAAAMAEILYDNLYSFAEKTDYMAKHPNMSFPLYVGVCVFYLVSEFLFMALGIWSILKAWLYKRTEMTKKELCMMAVPSVAGVAGYGIMQYYRHFYIMETGKNTDVYDMLALLYYGISTVTVIVVIVLYQSIKAKQEEKLQHQLLATQIDNIRQHIRQVESLYQDLHSTRHDVANHIITLERLYEKNKAEEARAYGAKLKAAFDEMTGEIKSGNPITDVILQEQKQEAESRNIRFQSEFYYPEGSDINAFDVSVILNNGLQNAIEHSSGKTPYISVLSYRKNNAYMIEISNCFAGELQWDAESGLPITSKRNPEGHGYGLANIRRVAGKYAGDIDITVKEGEFRLSVLLMVESVPLQ